MKISLSWIKDYVKLPEDMDLTRLAYDLTMSTVEVEGVTELAGQFDHMVVGVINAVEAHPNADKLRICKTDIGGGDVRDIVCGGSNLEKGMKVAVAKPGSIVRWHGQGDPVEIKNAKLRGVESYGMICASSEIGLADLFPTETESEILDLTQFDAPAGTPLAEALDMDDIILEIDNKSMTNRPDLWGHYGIAREIAALYDLPLMELKPFAADCDSDFTVSIEDTERCPRYIGVQIDGVFVKPAPYQMQSRIWRVGMRPINALVDITNYVMLATGQPTHAFDSDNISGHINVRRAGEGESLLLLNGKELTLCPDDLAICDDEGAVALAGVMGGAKDSILPKTKKVILEVANFESTGIRRTALRYDNRTEASARYEKAVDPERCDLALSIAMEYFAQLYPEMHVTGFCDKYEKKLERAKIDISLGWLRKRLGKDIPNDLIKKKLEEMGFTITFSGDTMCVVAPTWRSTGDVSIKDDVMEEVARMYGYERFEPTPITTSFEGAINQLAMDLTRNIKEYLAFRCGMQEVFTYPWMKNVFVDAFLPDKAQILALSTPPAPDEKYIRSSLLPNLCEAVVKNERYFTDFAIFEEAQVFRNADYKSLYDETESLPDQRRNIAGAFASSIKSVEELFRTAKGVIEYMPRYTHMEAISFKREVKPVWADNSVWLNLFVGKKQVGNLALLSKKASLTCGIKNLSVLFFEIDVTCLKPFRSRTNSFSHLAEYPMTDYDISLLFDPAVKWESIQEVIEGNRKKNQFLHGAAFVDEYRGKQIPEDKKSVTVRLSIGSLDKTLTSQEIEGCAGAVIKSLEHVLGAQLRRS
ncbi:MAG: phenylalanine--tRNA ligase subunit beta [Bacteroidales bacterium]|nr:phenylalanine--tRNA ligase subunit beta [Bacteroidales bacterium]MCM1414392.1 phenylalanine--tRNA ligase subunit beta [bacterium]MCM1422272.1 phenylalanine--tRNA ligase subunit beta [bacterium]